MPKAFTDAQRSAIRRRLLTNARETLGRVGARRLNVGQLARESGISKGAFYLFFPSKEALIMEVLGLLEAEARSELEKRLARRWKEPRELVERFLRFQFEVFEREPALAVLAHPDEAAFLMRSIPPEALARTRAEDDAYFTAIFHRWQDDGLLAEDVDVQVLARIPAVALALLQQREMIGPERFDGVVELLIVSLARQLSASRVREDSP